MAVKTAPVRRRPTSDGLPRRWWMVVLVLFLLFDVALVALAVNVHRASPTSGGQTPAASSVASSSPAPTPTPATSPTVTPNAAIPQRQLAAVSADVAWRGAIGTCPEGPLQLGYTSDGGGSWKAVDPALATGASTLVRIVPSSSLEANVVTLNAECAPQLVGTFVAGEAWEDYSANLASYWYVDPADRASVHSPAGVLPAPCESVVALATLSAEAAILCADQRIYVSIADGTQWSAAIEVPGAVAIDGSADGYVVAVAGQGDCPGTSVVTVAGGVPGVPIGCFGDAVQAGQTAVAVAGDGTLWLWAGENLARSNSGGETWD